MIFYKMKRTVWHSHQTFCAVGQQSEHSFQGHLFTLRFFMYLITVVQNQNANVIQQPEKKQHSLVRDLTLGTSELACVNKSGGLCLVPESTQQKEGINSLKLSSDLYMYALVHMCTPSAHADIPNKKERKKIRKCLKILQIPALQVYKERCYITV